MVDPQLTRRALFGRAARSALAVGVAVAGVSLLEALAPVPTSAPASTGATPGLATKTATTILPTYVPFSRPKPDLPGSAVVEAGYLTFPRSLVKTVAETPGSGADITVVVQSTRPPAPALSDNAAWQELNKRLSANLKLVISSDVDYKNRFATTIASGDIPDLLSIPLYQNPAGMYGALRALFADLTPYLAGDAVTDYPNLANIPTFHWKNVANAGGIYGVPVPNSVFLNAKYVDQALLDQVGMSKGPPTLDELTALMKAFTRPQANLYATAFARAARSRKTLSRSSSACRTTGNRTIIR